MQASNNWPVNELLTFIVSQCIVSQQVARHALLHVLHTSLGVAHDLVSTRAPYATNASYHSE